MILPKQMQFVARFRAAFRTMRDPRQSDAIVQMASNTTVGQPLAFTLSGTGALADTKSENAEAVNSTNTPKSGSTVRDPGARTVAMATPAIASSSGRSQWYILGGLGVLLAAGTISIAQRSTKRKTPQPLRSQVPDDLAVSQTTSNSGKPVTGSCEEMVSWSGSVLEARATNSLRSCFFSCCSRFTSRNAASSRLARCRAARRRAVACRFAVLSSCSPSAFRMRTCSRASSRCAFSFSLRRKLLPLALALIFVPSSVTRSNVISHSALSMPSTCTNKSSNATLLSERIPDRVQWLTASSPQSHCSPGSNSHCRASSRAGLIPRL